MAEFTLRLIGMTDDQIRKEHFVIDRTPPQPLLSDRSPKEITIHLMGRTHQFNVSFPSTILDAASQQGLELPYSCKAGRCGTCTAYCIHGKIIMGTNEVLTERDLAKGLVLLCVGYAATNAEIVVE
jgi:ring-1,2-phenylacetyl-CoA epoxidase subunit PaaE